MPGTQHLNPKGRRAAAPDSTRSAALFKGSPMYKYAFKCIVLLLLGTLLFVSCKEKKDKAVPSSTELKPVVDIHVPNEPVSPQIPFEFDNNLIVIACQLNNIPCRMMLDTGATSISVFEGKLTKFNLKKTGQSSFGHSVDGVFESNIVEEFTLELPDNIKIVSRNCVALVDLKTNPKIDGIIGGQVFKALGAVIDYKQKKLMLKTIHILKNAEHKDPNRPADAVD
jgi:predicted aspartyl protease